MRFTHKKFEPFGAVRISAAKNNNPQNPDFFAIIWIAEPKAALIKNAMLASALLRVRPKNSLPICHCKRLSACRRVFAQKKFHHFCNIPAFVRAGGGRTLAVASNLSGEPQRVDLPGTAKEVLLCSDGAPGLTDDALILAPWQAAVVELA